MLVGNQMLGIQEVFQYGFAYATNFKSAITLSRLNFAKISEIDCKVFEYAGVKPFQLI